MLKIRRFALHLTWPFGSVGPLGRTLRRPSWTTCWWTGNVGRTQQKVVLLSQMVAIIILFTASVHTTAVFSTESAQLLIKGRKFLLMQQLVSFRSIEAELWLHWFICFYSVYTLSRRGHWSWCAAWWHYRGGHLEATCLSQTHPAPRGPLSQGWAETPGGLIRAAWFILTLSSNS